MRTLTSILGNSQRLDGGAMFGNAPKALWSRWLTPDEQNRVRLCCRCLLVRDGDRTILFETGIGVFFEPKLRDRYGVVEPQHVLLESLEVAGVSPADIDIVVLSHMHFDHAGGLVTAWREDAPMELVFPRAQFIVSRVAWERTQNPHPRDRASFVPAINMLLADSGRLILAEEEGSSNNDRSARRLLGPGFRFLLSHGHTPGLMLTEIDMPDGPVVFCADLIPGHPWVHVPITMGYDRFPELLVNEKQDMLEYLSERNGRLFYTHDPAYAISGIERDERGRFRAANGQAVLTELGN